MSGSTQVAFQIADEDLARLDALAARRSQSRAALLRTATRELLERRREEEIDAALAEGYGSQPPGSEVDAWSAVSIEGLEMSDLDW